MADPNAIERACRELADAIAHAHNIAQTLRETTTELDKYPAWIDLMCTELDRLAAPADGLIAAVNHAKRG